MRAETCTGSSSRFPNKVLREKVASSRHEAREIDNAKSIRSTVRLQRFPSSIDGRSAVIAPDEE